MPTYTFRDIKTDEPVVRFMTWSEYDGLEKVGNDYMVDGRLMRRDLRADMSSVPPPANWPMESEAFGCGSHEIAEHRQAALDKGVKLDYTPTGAAIFRDRKHRSECLRAFGFRDNDGGYGD